jgi:hypothetical protein
MTVIMGLLCNDGIVIGSDSAVTFSNVNIPTIEQECIKIDIYHKKVILAGTGEVGLCQRFGLIIERYWLNENILDVKHNIDIGKDLSRFALQDFSYTFKNPGTFGAIVAFPHKNDFYLCEFALKDFQPEFKNFKIWYVSMGIGQNIADTLLGIIKYYFMQEGIPNLQQGIFYLLWVLDHTIKLSPSGIKGPSQIATLSRLENNNYEAKILKKEDLSEHIENIEQFEKHIREYKEFLEGRSTKIKIPKIPDFSK